MEEYRVGKDHVNSLVMAVRKQDRGCRKYTSKNLSCMLSMGIYSRAVLVMTLYYMVQKKGRRRYGIICVGNTL